MSSIDNNYNNVDVNSRYAFDIQQTESFKHDFNIRDLMDTRAISDHVKVLDYVPKPDAFDWLFGTGQHRRWAYFLPPASFAEKRVFFFEGRNLVEKDEAETARVESIDCSHTNPKEQKERHSEQKIIADFCALKQQLREDYNYIMGRVHQFVQG